MSASLMHLIQSGNPSPPCGINAQSRLFMQKVVEVVQAGLKAKLWSGGSSGDSAKHAHKFPERKSDPSTSVLMLSSCSTSSSEHRAQCLVYLYHFWFFDSWYQLSVFSEVVQVFCFFFPPHLGFLGNKCLT